MLTIVSIICFPFVPYIIARIAAPHVTWNGHTITMPAEPEHTRIATVL